MGQNDEALAQKREGATASLTQGLEGDGEARGRLVDGDPRRRGAVVVEEGDARVGAARKGVKRLGATRRSSEALQFRRRSSQSTARQRIEVAVLGLWKGGGSGLETRGR